MQFPGVLDVEALRYCVFRYAEAELPHPDIDGADVDSSEYEESEGGEGEGHLEASGCWFPAGGERVAGVIWLVEFVADDEVDECAEGVRKEEDADEEGDDRGFVHCGWSWRRYLDGNMCGQWCERRIETLLSVAVHSVSSN